MSDKLFIDTNILVYAYDSHEPDKQRTAQRLIKNAVVHESGVISAQVLNEFYVTVTKRIKTPLSTEEAKQIIHLFGVLETVDIDYMLVKRAIDTHEHYQVGYWDALIIAAAERAGCRSVVTEDLNDGQVYHGLIVENPFV